MRTHLLPTTTDQLYLLEGFVHDALAKERADPQSEIREDLETLYAEIDRLIDQTACERRAS